MSKITDVSKIFDKSLVSVVIPIYKTMPSASETYSLEQCFKVLNKYNIIFVAPYSLDINFYEKYHTDNLVNIKFERFADSYFKSITGYNQLVLSEEFYQRFSNYKYILLYQLDAFVFKDELVEWCLKNYDYVAAPWMDDNFVKYFWTSNSKIGRYLNNVGISPNTVGNGGLSLRKIKKFLLVLKLFKYKVKKWDSNEDIFWALYAPYYFPFISIPTRKEALQFAFETEPKKCFEINNNNLPMGCHGWEKYEPDFWKTYIKL